MYTKITREILFNKIPLKSKDLKNLWNNICYIPQEPFFLNETKKYNISLSRNIDSKEEKYLFDILKIVDLYEFVNNLDDGINSILSEEASNISGGQKQRIAIARALFFNKNVLVFDESTSALDAELEQKIMTKFLKIPDKTILISTHGNNILVLVKECMK